MLNVEALVRDNYPTLWQRHPLLARPLTGALKLLCREKAFRQFARTYPELKGFDFIEQVLDHFQFRYSTRDDERERIPARGRVVIVANHPIGSLDGLVLLKLVREVRPDVKVVANEILTAIDPLHPLLLPVDNMGGNTHRRQLEAIRNHLKNDGAVIFFPAGEVSRLGPKGIRDGRWRPGFLRMAAAANAPILPVHIDGRNSAFFYALSFLARPVSTLWLVREMFKQSKNCITLRIGEPVAWDDQQRTGIALKERAQLFRRHVYRLGRGRPGVFTTRSAVAHPESRAQLRYEVHSCELLGRTADNMCIYLYHHRPDSCVMREIGRLREMAFRAVGEGTGRRRDTDVYDRHYFHLVLWNEAELEIVGAYRLCDARSRPHHALYSSSLFDLLPAMNDVLTHGLELGRSFVQPRYWGRRSLDYLWFGIGAFLRSRPHYRYLFGPVSISAAYPRRALEMLVYFYSVHFPSERAQAKPRLPFAITPGRRRELARQFPGRNYRDEFVRLKSALSHMNLSVPTLYKQYPDVCQPGGVHFAGFNVDPAFANCVDGLIILDTDKLKPAKRQRYIEGPAAYP